jgi:hypothetical protein
MPTATGRPHDHACCSGRVEWRRRVANQAPSRRHQSRRWDWTSTSRVRPGTAGLSQSRLSWAVAGPPMLPPRFSLGPSWLVPAVEALLLAALVAADRLRQVSTAVRRWPEDRRPPPQRATGYPTMNANRTPSRDRRSHRAIAQIRQFGIPRADSLRIQRNALNRQYVPEYPGRSGGGCSPSVTETVWPGDGVPLDETVAVVAKSRCPVS